MHHMSLYLVILLDSRWRYSQLVCHFLGKENCIRSHYDRLNSNFNSLPDFFHISTCFSWSMASKVWGPHNSRYKSPQQLYNQLPHILPYVRENKQACTRPERVFITKGLFTWREDAPANRATRLEGLEHSPPLHASHLTGTVSGLRGLKQNGRPKKLYFHLLSVSCTGTGPFSAWDSSITLISSDWLS